MNNRTSDEVLLFAYRKYNEQKERADAKIRQQELKRLAQKTLNISDERSKEQKEAIDIAKGARQRLEELRTELQSQSIDVKENKNFQKLEADVQKKERAVDQYEQTNWPGFDNNFDKPICVFGMLRGTGQLIEECNRDGQDFYFFDHEFRLNIHYQ